MILAFQLSWENAKRMEIPNWLRDSEDVDNVEITFTNKIENSQIAIIKFLDGSYLEAKANDLICLKTKTGEIFIEKSEPK